MSEWFAKKNKSYSQSTIQNKNCDKFNLNINTNVLEKLCVKSKKVICTY